MHRQWTDSTSALVRRLNDLVPTGMTDTPQITPDYRHDQPPAIQKEELLPFTAFSHDDVMFKTKATPSLPIIYVMKDFKVAIEIDPAVNGNKPMQLQPRELFGFGLGTFSVDTVENLKGSIDDSIVFSVENDTNRIVWVHGADGDATKEMFPLCEAIAQALDRKRLGRRVRAIPQAQAADGRGGGGPFAVRRQ